MTEPVAFAQLLILHESLKRTFVDLSGLREETNFRIYKMQIEEVDHFIGHSTKSGKCGIIKK